MYQKTWITNKEEKDMDNLEKVGVLIIMVLLVFAIGYCLCLPIPVK